MKDHDGEEFASLDAARQEALRAALDIIAEDLRSERPLTMRSFEICDEAENKVLTLSFEDALRQQGCFA